MYRQNLVTWVRLKEHYRGGRGRWRWRGRWRRGGRGRGRDVETFIDRHLGVGRERIGGQGESVGEEFCCVCMWDPLPHPFSRPCPCPYPSPRQAVHALSTSTPYTATGILTQYCHAAPLPLPLPLLNLGNLQLGNLRKLFRFFWLFKFIYFIRLFFLLSRFSGRCFFEALVPYRF